MIRKDSSIQSANLPNTSLQNEVNKDFAIYRCLVIEVFFIDDKKNLTFDNRQVTYDLLILGGKKEGQILNNARTSNHLGGQYNYHERIYRKAINPFSGPKAVKIPEQKGDIVYVSFINGDPSFPLIIGCGVSPLDKTTTGSDKAKGSIWKQEYNGVFQEINKNGEFELVRKGGVYNEAGQYFVPADRSNEEENGNTTEEKFQARMKFAKDYMLWEDPKSVIKLDKANEKLSFTIGENKVLLEIDGKGDKFTLKLKSGTLIEADGSSGLVSIKADSGNLITIDKSGEITIKATSKVSVDAPLVDVGSNAAYAVTLFENLLSEFMKHTHPIPGNIGPPVTSIPSAPLISLVGSTSVYSKD